MKTCLNNRLCSWLDDSENNKICLYQEKCGYQKSSLEDFHTFISERIYSMKNEIKYWHKIHNIPLNDIYIDLNYKK